MPKLYDSEGRFIQKIPYDPGTIARFLSDGYQVFADDGVEGEQFTLENYAVQSWCDVLESRKGA